jgi:hypothetical protein
LIVYSALLLNEEENVLIPKHEEKTDVFVQNNEVFPESITATKATTPFTPRDDKLTTRSDEGVKDFFNNLLQTQTKWNNKKTDNITNNNNNNNENNNKNNNENNNNYSNISNDDNDNNYNNNNNNNNTNNNNLMFADAIEQEEVAIKNNENLVPNNEVILLFLLNFFFNI